MKSNNLSSYLEKFENKKERSNLVSIVCRSIYYEQYFDRIVYKHNFFSLGDGKKGCSFSLNRSIDSYWYDKSLALENCGTFLEFARNVYDLDDVKLVNANFCRLRICPMCSWRRELKLFSEMSDIMSFISDPQRLRSLEIPQKYYNVHYKFLMVTFTLKNCSGDELGNTIDLFQKAYSRKLMQWKRLKSVLYGQFRSLEVTYNKDNNTFHPHIHCIWAVPSGYFTKKGKYISHDEITALWASACDIDYVPIVDIRKIYSNDSMSSEDIASAVAEVCKYAVKDSDYTDLDDFETSSYVLKILDTFLSGRRLVSFGGIFKEVRKAINQNNICLSDSLLDNIDDSIQYVIDSYVYRNGYHFADYGEDFKIWAKKRYA